MNTHIQFLTYIYDRIVVPEYPTPANLLNTLRLRADSEQQFFDTLLSMDIYKAKKEMGIGEVSAKGVVNLCDMMRRIICRSGSKFVFENSDKVQIVAPIIDARLKSEHIRVYHTYQKFLKRCNGSIDVFYFKVAGLSYETIKFQGINHETSKELLDIFCGLLDEIDSYVNGVESQLETALIPNLIKLRLYNEQINNIVRIAKKCGHFPVFATISYMMKNWANDRQKDIIRRSLNTVYGNPVENLNDVADSLGLSRERVRQLREECYENLSKFPQILKDLELLDNYKYTTKSEYDFNLIREEEEIDFSNELILIYIPLINNELTIVGNIKKVLFQTINSRIYLVPKQLAQTFEFDKFIDSIDEMLKEKRFYPYRDDLEIFVRGLVKTDISNEEFYAIIRECRQILQMGYPENIINSQIYFPVNAHKTIPYLIEDILHEYNRPMTAEEISDELNKHHPELDQSPSKIGPNALRNSNIVAVSRTSTYALVEWNYTEKCGGTIRNLVEEYLNSLTQPIAPLTDICNYISKFRSDVKMSSVKTNLWAESNNRFSVYCKEDITYIGLSEHTYDGEYILQKKNQGRRSFMDNIEHLENFIKKYGRFPYSSGVEDEEIRLNRFYQVSKSNIRKGSLSSEETAEIDRIDIEYASLKKKKERISWEERFERFVKHINENGDLPYPSSKEFAWYKENKALYDAGALDANHTTNFSFLVKIVERML